MHVFKIGYPFINAARSLQTLYLLSMQQGHGKLRRILIHYPTCCVKADWVQLAERDEGLDG